MMRPEPGSDNKPSPELARLLDRWCNRDIDPAGVRQLDQLLEADEAARQNYLERMALEAELYACNACQPKPSVASSTPLSTREKNGRRRLASMLGLAASLLGVATLSSLLTFSAMRSAKGPAHIGRDSNNQQAHAVEERPRDTVVQPTVARVSATRNCRWSKSMDRIGFGAELAAGQRLDLDAGVAEITFDSGVSILLEGPASLDINNDHDAVLKSGRLAATVPQGARRFAVRALTLGVGDHRPDHQRSSDLQGAQFGLLADGRRGGEVHVFRGSIRAHLLNDVGVQLRTVSLNPSEAARVRPASTTVERFQADGDRFVRSLFSSGGPHDGLYAYEGFDYPAGPLSWQNGGFGWAGPWADIETSGQPNGEATNVVVETSLAYDEMATLGNRASQTAQRNRIRRALSTSIGGVFDAAGLVENRDGHRLLGRNGKTLYVSFLQRVNKLDDVFYGFELHRGDGNANRVLCVGNGADGAGYGATSNYNAYGLKNYPKLGDETTGVNFLVLKVEFGAGDRDTVTIYRNPASLVDESRCDPAGSMRGNFSFDRISLGNFDGTKRHEIDEIRLGTTFRAVTGQRDPAGERLNRRVAELGPHKWIGLAVGSGCGRLELVSNKAPRQAVLPSFFRHEF